MMQKFISWDTRSAAKRFLLKQRKSVAGKYSNGEPIV